MNRAQVLAGIARDRPTRIAIVAPAGYGKSVLAQQIAREFGTVVLCDCAAPDEAVVTALESWMSHPGPSTLMHVENAELLGETARPLIGACLNSDRPIVICSRVPVDLPATRFQPPASSLTVTAADLRFSTREILTLFAGMAYDDPNAARVWEISRGWPIIVGLLHRAWRSGRLDAVLDDAEHAEFHTMADYVDEEILCDLATDEFTALCAAVTFEHPTPRNVARVIGNDEATVTRLLNRAPISTFDGASFDIHPIVRIAVRERERRARRAFQPPEVNPGPDSATDFLQEITRRAEDLGWRRASGAKTVIRLLNGDIVRRKTQIPVAAKEFALLAFLAQRTSAMDREELIDELWPQAQPSNALGALRVYVTKIRKRVGTHDVIIAQNNRYRLGAAVTTDLDEIRSLLFRAEIDCSRDTAVELATAGELLLAGLPTFLADYPASSRLAYDVDQLIERTSVLLDRLCAQSTPGITALLSPLRELMGKELLV